MLFTAGISSTVEVEITGPKNAAVAIIPAALMVDGICRIENVLRFRTDMLLSIFPAWRTDEGHQPDDDRNRLPG